MFTVDNYEPGSNLTIMNVIYQRTRKDERTGKRTKDYAIVVYKDNDTGKKYITTVFEPTYTWYLAKPEIQIDHNMHFIDRDKVIPITCKYNDILKSIAKETGNMDLFMENIKSGNYSMNKMFYTHNRVFNADMPIQNFIRSQFSETYQNPVCPITISFFDIESDIIDSVSDNVIIGECPVNAIGMYFTGTNIMYSFVLRNPNNSQIQQLENNLNNNFDLYLKKFRDFVEYDLGSKEKVEKYGLKNIKLSVGFFDTEAELISTFFGMIKKLSPDIVTAWNGFGYDLPQLIERAKKLNIDVEAMVSDTDAFPKLCEYFVDERNKNNPEERCDYANFASRSVYVDQEIIYASRRKGQGAIGSYALDFVGGQECGVRKLDYHNITTDIAKFCWKDFETFWLYNLIDVIVQVCIEAQTEDIKYMFNNVIEMNTPYEKIFRQTNYLFTKGADFYKNHEGVIMGNNVNKFKEPPKEKFPGAFVADPNLLSDRNKVKVNGKPISKLNNANDFDYKSLYPSLLREFNMAPNTQIGMIQFEKPPYTDNISESLGNGGTYSENLASYNFIEFCHRWIHLANIDEMLNDVDEFFSRYRTPMYKGKGNLKLDKEQRIVAYTVDKSKAAYIERPIPDWVKKSVDDIRKNIPLL